jgi:hypothetical protein
MPYSANSVFSSALSAAWVTPGGRPAVEAGGTFQPTLNEQIAISRSSADEQFDTTHIEQFKGQMQNRLNFLQGQLQQAYTALMSATSAAYVKDSLGATDNKFLYSNSRGNGYQDYTIAFKNIGKDGLSDVDGDAKKEINDGDALGGGGLAIGAGKKYSMSTSGTDVRARAMMAHGAAMDIKQKVGITMRAEEFNDPALGFMTPGFNHKVQEYETQLSTGAYWAGVNYLYAWRPSHLQYTYVDAIGQNSDAAGFESYLSEGRKTNAEDKGDGSLTQQLNGNAIKWQGGGFSEGYLATYGDNANSVYTEDGDIGLTPGGGDDDMRFANTYYARTRSIGVEHAQFDLKEFAANGGKGTANALDGKLLDITDPTTALRNTHDDGIGIFDVINGNVFQDQTLIKNGTDPDKAWLPGSGKIDETFTGNWLGRQHKIDYFNGQAVNGNQANPIFGNLELARYQTYWDPDLNRNFIEQDLNGNGILDPGEDIGNGILDGGEDLNANGILDAGEDLADGKIDQYLNGVSISPLAAKNQRGGQIRQFRGPTGNIVYEVDARPQDQNSLAEFIMETMRKPMYRDIFRLGLFKDVVINGGATTPAGGVANGTLRLSFLMAPDHTQGRVIPGKGYKPGLRGSMIVFQDKFNAKGA